jgi:hypothetical protein
MRRALETAHVVASRRYQSIFKPTEQAGRQSNRRWQVLARGLAFRGRQRRVRQRLPMPLLGLDSDNGSEFINQSLYDYCRQGGITFTRSRAWKKNDSAHVEQKNGAVVRQLVGYDRFASKAAYAQLTRVYQLARLHVNFFQPVQKLVSKQRDGAHVHRVYDRAQTPASART